MEFNNKETISKNEGMKLSSKVLIGIIACIILSILVISVIMVTSSMRNNNVQVPSSWSLYVDGKIVNAVNVESLLTTMDGIDYVNIEEFSKLVGYDYHKGEYKSYSIDNNKCYAEGPDETVSFYLGENKIYKVPTGHREKEYEVYTFDGQVKKINKELYIPMDGLDTSFNVVLEVTDDSWKIYTLDFLVKSYNIKIEEWGYSSIEEQSFENDKALLYGYLIVKKEGGQYKIIDLNQKEVVLDRYSSIQFSEYMQEFYVKDSASQKFGVINLDGTTKIDFDYDSIISLDKEKELYIVEQNKKYGVVKSGNTIVIFPEFDQIGLNSNNILSNNYMMLDTLIPVCKDSKWGAYDKKGKKVIELLYDGFGYDLTTIDINGTKEVVQPVAEIKRANGIVVKKDEKYGLLDITGKQLIKTVVDAIYMVPGEKDEELKYFMLYKNEKINVIKELISRGILEEKKDEAEEIFNNTILNVTIDTNVIK